MITNTNNVGSTPPPAPDPRRGRPAAAPASPGEDSLSTASATQLKAALENTPAIRPETVARAQKLAVDPSYPPLAIIEKVALLIAASYDPSAE